MHRLKSQRGQALVEFALILPILLAILIGVFDFGTAYNQKNNENYLANQAARYASVNACAPCGGQTIANWVKTTGSTSHLRSSATHITFCLPPLSGGGTNNGSVGMPLQVTITSPFSWLGVLTSTGLPGGSIVIDSTVTTRILQVNDGSGLYTAAAC